MKLLLADCRFPMANGHWKTAIALIEVHMLSIDWFLKFKLITFISGIFFSPFVNCPPLAECFNFNWLFI